MNAARIHSSNRQSVWISAVVRGCTYSNHVKCSFSNDAAIELGSQRQRAAADPSGSPEWGHFQWSPSTGSASGGILMGNQKPLQKENIKTTENETPANTNSVWLNCFGLAQKQHQGESLKWADVKVKEPVDHSRVGPWRHCSSIYIFISQEINANFYSHMWTEWKTSCAAVPGSEVTTPVVMWPLHKVGFIFFTLRLWCHCYLSLIKHKPKFYCSLWLKGFFDADRGKNPKRKLFHSITEKVLMCICDRFTCANLGGLDPTPTRDRRNLR